MLAYLFIYFILLFVSLSTSKNIHISKYLYNVTKKDKRNVVVFVEDVAIIMFVSRHFRQLV